MSDLIAGDIESSRAQFAEFMNITDSTVIYKLRDRNARLVAEWEKAFKKEIKSGLIEVSLGDIFKGGPSADAIVSPANSFGFMDGGIDLAYSNHFGWQIQRRLQAVIQEKYHGELLVGQAEIMPVFEDGEELDTMEWKGFNEDKAIKYLVSAPTMRVPMAVDDTANAYLAFRAIVLAVQSFNNENTGDKIKTVLCPGLGTAVGRMPFDRCAYQMKEAFRTFVDGECHHRIYPTRLEVAFVDMHTMQTYKTRHESDEDEDDTDEHSQFRRVAPSERFKPV